MAAHCAADAPAFRAGTNLRQQLRILARFVPKECWERLYLGADGGVSVWFTDPTRNNPACGKGSGPLTASASPVAPGVPAPHSFGSAALAADSGPAHPPLRVDAKGERVNKVSDANEKTKKKVKKKVKSEGRKRRDIHRWRLRGFTRKVQPKMAAWTIQRYVRRYLSSRSTPPQPDAPPVSAGPSPPPAGSSPPVAAFRSDDHTTVPSKSSPAGISPLPSVPEDSTLPQGSPLHRRPRRGKAKKPS